MAPLSQGDRAIVREIAFEVAEIVVKRYVRSLRWLLIGLAIGLTAGGTGVAGVFVFGAGRHAGGRGAGFGSGLLLLLRLRDGLELDGDPDQGGDDEDADADKQGRGHQADDQPAIALQPSNQRIAPAGECL